VSVLCPRADAHRVPADVGVRDDRAGVTSPLEAASDTPIVLPLHGGLTDDDCTIIAAALVAAVDAT
jgi:hypothetical protein